MLGTGSLNANMGRGGPVQTGRPCNAPSYTRRVAAVSSDGVEVSKRVRDKRAEHWFVTVKLGVVSKEDSDEVRFDLVHYFGELLSGYCIALEKYHVSNTYHLHCYLRFVDKQYFSFVRECVSALYDECQIDVQSCKKVESVIRYVSKEDRELIFNNICEKYLSFQYLAYKWALRTPEFHCHDPFVMEHYNSYRFLEKLHSGLHFARVNKVFYVTSFFEVPVGWCHTVYTWYRNFWRTSGLRKKQLYLYGQHHCGKSTFIEKIVGHSNMDFVFWPGVGTFAFEGLSKEHKVIIFEDFEFEKYKDNMDILKRLLEGRKFKINRKGLTGVVFEFSGCVIIVSNNDFNVLPPALLDRLLVVYVDHPSWVVERTFVEDIKDVLPSQTSLESTPPEEEWICLD